MRQSIFKKCSARLLTTSLVTHRKKYKGTAIEESDTTKNKMIVISHIMPIFDMGREATHLVSIT